MSQITSDDHRSLRLEERVGWPERNSILSDSRLICLDSEKTRETVAADERTP